MKQIAVVEDSISKQPFAVLILSENNPIAFGALGQGETWAHWANDTKMSLEQIQESLDVTLFIKKPESVEDINIEYLKTMFTDLTFSELKNEISKKALLKIINTKSSEPPTPKENQPEYAFNIDNTNLDEEAIFNWPLTDIGLALIDVAYKQIAVEYKTKAFLHDIKTSSLALKVKGARAVWDVNMPGGGGWRCPDDTPFGGQYTNRLGAGCTFGMMRRIGRGLVAASVRDIMKPSNDPKNIDKPILSRAGHSMIDSDEKRRVARADKFNRRVTRRAEKLDTRNAKEKLRAVNPSARQIYSSLNTNMPRRDRAKITAGTIIERTGNAMRNSGFNSAMRNSGSNSATTRRTARRIPAAKTSKKKPLSKFKLDKKIPPEYRFYGGILPSKISSFGLIRSDNSHYMHFDKMKPKSGLLANNMWGKPEFDVLFDKEGGMTFDSLPNFITQQEYLEIEDRMGAILADEEPILRTTKEWFNEFAKNPNDTVLSRVEADEFLSPNNYPNRVFWVPDDTIPVSFRNAGGILPAGIANNGVFYNEHTGEIRDYQSMLPVSDMDLNEQATLRGQFNGVLPSFVTANEYQGMLYSSPAYDVNDVELGKRLNPNDSVDKDKIVSIFGTAMVSALLDSKNTGFKKPSKRSIIAAQMRQSAENILGDNADGVDPLSRRQKRRMSKVDKKKKFKNEPIEDMSMYGLTDLPMEFLFIDPPKHEALDIDAPPNKAAFNRFKLILDSMFIQMGIPFLNEDASASQKRFGKFDGVNIPGKSSVNWADNLEESANFMAALNDSLKITPTDIPMLENVPLRNFRLYKETVMKETMEIGYLDSNGFVAANRVLGKKTQMPVRYITYKIFQPKDSSARTEHLIEYGLWNSTPRSLLRSSATHDDSTWTRAGETNVFFDELGNILHVDQQGINPLLAVQDMNTVLLSDKDLLRARSRVYVQDSDDLSISLPLSEYRLKNSADIKFTSGVTGAMDVNVYTTKKGVALVQKNNKLPTPAQSKRQRRGKSPKKPGIINRFGDRARIFQKPTAAERQLRDAYGRKPRSTDSRQERIAKRLRRTASRVLQQPINPEDLPSEIQLATAYPLAPTTNIPRPTTVNPTMKPLDLLRPDARVHPTLFHLQTVAPPSIPFGSQEMTDWFNNEKHFEALLSLNDLLKDTNRDDQAARDLYTSIFFDEPFPDSFDEEHQDDLQKTIDEWSESFNDPNQPTSPNTNSNFGLLETAFDSQGTEFKYTIDKKMPAYMETASGLVAHYFDNDGNHLVSAVEYTDKNTVSSVVKYIASPYTKEQIRKKSAPDKTSKPSFVQRVRGKFRRVKNPKASGQTQPSIRARATALTLSSSRSGLRYGSTTVGPELVDINRLSTFEKVSLANEMKDELDWHVSRFRKKLNLSPNDALTEDAIIDYVDFLRKTDTRAASIDETYLHNFLQLNSWSESSQPSGDGLNYILNLKPALRKRIMDKVPNSRNTAVVEKTRRPWRIYGQTFNPIPQAPASPIPQAPANPIPQAPASPIPQAPASPQVLAPATRIPRPAGTGPQLTPGLGNAALGIVYDAREGLYLDSSTGLFVEDLSNLPIDQHSIYTPSDIEYETPLMIPVVGAPTNPLDMYPQFPSIAQDPLNLARVNIPHDVIAPGKNPSDPELQLTPQPRTKAAKIWRNGVVSSFAQTWKKRLQQYQSFKQVLISTASSGRQPKTSVKTIDDDVMVSMSSTAAFVELGYLRSGWVVGTPIEKINAQEIYDRAAIAAKSNEIFQEVVPELSVTIQPTTIFQDVHRYPNNPIEMGLVLALPTDKFYLLGNNRRSSQGGTTTWMDSARMRAAFESVNQSLQLDYLSKNPPPSWTQVDIQNNKTKSIQSWVTTAKLLENAYKSAIDERDMQLALWRVGRDSEAKTNPSAHRKKADSYVAHGYAAEQYKYLLDTHIVNNPTAIDAIEDSARASLEYTAKIRNERNRRIAARKAAGITFPVGIYDNDPDILDPWNSNSPPLGPRTADEILRIRNDQATKPLFGELSGPAQIGDLTDEEFEMFQAIGKHWIEDLNGGTNWTTISPTTGQAISYANLDEATMGVIWEYNGANSLPVLATKEEILSALTETLPHGGPKYIVISRGIGGQTGMRSAVQMQSVQQYLTGDRFIPGQGGNQYGSGEYWSQTPASWSSFHGGAGGTIIGIIPEDFKLANNQLMITLYGDSSNSYNGLWALYNAFGAPESSRGVNTSHGQQSIYGIPENSLLPDPNTGQLTAAQLKEVDDHIDRLTAPGEMLDVNAILNPYFQGGNYPQGLNSSKFDTSQGGTNFPNPGNHTNAEILQDIKEQKELHNSWLRRRMVIASDILRKLQDESLGGQAAKDNNQLVWHAFRSNLYMDSNSIALLMGYDGLVEYDNHTVNSLYQTPMQIRGASDEYPARIIKVINRSGLILENQPVNSFRDYKDDLFAIKYPNGNTATGSATGHDWN